VLDFAIRTASVQVFHAGERKGIYRGMGTTVVACLVAEPARVVVGHVGDSRAYLLRGGSLAMLTRDHTQVEALVDAGKMSPSQATRSIGRHLLARYLGDPSVRPDLLDQRLDTGDRLLLCSDGLHDIAPVRSIQRVMARRGTPAQI